MNSTLPCSTHTAGNRPDEQILPEQLAACFTGKGRWKILLPDILEAMAAIGRARRLDDGRWPGIS